MNQDHIPYSHLTEDQLTKKEAELFTRRKVNNFIGERQVEQTNEDLEDSPHCLEKKRKGMRK